MPIEGSSSNALLFNLEAHAEILLSVAAIFPAWLGHLPDSVSGQLGSYLANDAAIALNSTGDPAGSMAAYGSALAAYLRTSDWKRAGNCFKEYWDAHSRCRIVWQRKIAVTGTASRPPY